ncbi:unnamed protein product [Cylicocyclus nassatus]|uniref:Cystatin domain-containing protein n=1 Tax=Cylicocyclus nassatus TaxID=53992 RepID=A0AA36DKG6_CYLNA|nr:unnamed protein product [Cylicocyclus nassatus]
MMTDIMSEAQNLQIKSLFEPSRLWSYLLLGCPLRRIRLQETNIMANLIFAFALFCAVALTSSTMMPGGKADQDPSSPRYMDMAWKAAKPLNEDSAANSGEYAMMPIKVLKAQSQVVAGVIYDLEVLYGESGCKKDGVDLSKLQMANCRVMNEGKRAIYKIHYYEKPWQNFLEIKVSKIRDVDAGETF